MTNMLKLLLIACTMAYTNAWAFDALMDHHADISDTTHALDASPFNTDQHDGDANAHGCDHCCHAAAHILALSNSHISQNVNMTNSIVAVQDVSAASYISLPDSPPPKFLF